MPKNSYKSSSFCKTVAAQAKIFIRAFEPLQNATQSKTNNYNSIIAIKLLTRQTGSFMLLHVDEMATVSNRPNSNKFKDSKQSYIYIQREQADVSRIVNIYIEGY
jgi:hypothetical protein